MWVRSSGIRRPLLVLLVVLAATGAGSAAELDQHGVGHSWQGEDSSIRIVDFAASWCRPCWTTLPRLQRLADDNPELKIIVVSVDESLEGRDLLVEKLELRLPVLWDGEHNIAEHFRPQGMPAIFVLDRNGTVVYSHLGSGDSEWDALRGMIEELSTPH